MLAQIRNIDKVSIVALAKRIESEEKTKTICELAAKLQVPLMSESRNRATIGDRLNRNEGAGKVVFPSAMVIVAKKIITILMIRTGAYQDNNSRRSYAPWFKQFIVDLKDKGTEYKLLSELTGIGLDTVMGFRKSVQTPLVKEPMDSKSEQLADAWNEAPLKCRESLGGFWYYLGKKHSDISISFKEMRQILINLGLRYPRGPRIPDHGVQVKQVFAPHAVWEGDGKQMKIRLNNREFVFSWYAYTDQNTTLLVGSNVGKVENSENFLEALKDSGQNAGTYPIGILIDNRLSDLELSPIREFCREHNIVLCRIFPGNSKSNGNIENNFSVFERFVGPIEVHGNTPEEIANSIAKNVVEIFTQLRNHSPRSRLHGNSPEEATRDTVRPEDKRSYIERLANRLDQENRNCDEKWELISPARKHFGAILPESEAKMKNRLGKYPVNAIITAQASYLAQIAKYPDRFYGPEYFMAILRNKQETTAKQTYNEAYRAGVERCQILLPADPKSLREYAHAIVDELLEIMEETTPTQQMLRLEALSWWLVNFSTKNSIYELWRLIGDVAVKTIAMSLRSWTTINEYLSERLGVFLISCE